jgi:hypothetical protein
LVSAPSSSTASVVAWCFSTFGVGDVEHVDQEIGDDDLLERGLERLDQIVRQAADEADGVGDEQLLVVGQRELARGRVERGEELVLDEHVRAGER